MNFRRNRYSIVLFSIFFSLFLGNLSKVQGAFFEDPFPFLLRNVEYQAGDISESGMNEILFIATPSQPDPENLIKNGYFLEDYSNWTRDLIDEGGSSKMSIVNSQNSPFDRALYMNQTGLGTLLLEQQIPVDSIDLTFSATFVMQATTGLIYGFSGSGYAMIVLDYLDGAGESLGFTRILNVNENLFAGTAFVGAPDKISDTNSMHNILIESDKVYKNYKLNIRKEVNENLLGINSDDIRSIKVVLIVGSTDKNASGTLTVSDLTLKPNH